MALLQPTYFPHAVVLKHKTTARGRRAGDAKLIAMCNLHGELDAKENTAMAEGTALRDELVAVYGEPCVSPTADELWGKDPRAPTLHMLNEAANQFGEERWDLEDSIVETEPVTLAGLIAKIRLTLHMTLFGVEEHTPELIVARKVLGETLAMLSALVGEAQPVGE